MEKLSDYTVLVVDDEETLRNAMVFDFKRKGFTVLSASNGAEAFELVKSRQVHLVVSDIRMPGGDGMSLLDKIREYNPEIPHLIFVTGFSDFSEAECMRRGAKKVLEKPFDRKVLMGSAMDVLGISGEKRT